MITSRIKYYVRALVLAVFLSAIGPIGVVAQSATQIERWRKAAEEGYAWAQFNLGLAYDKGEGVAQNYRLAARWYRKAAEQGDAKSQTNLGLMYRNGRGVRRNDKLAVRWYRKAAEQGNVPAQSNLGLMYSSGRGVRRNAKLAVRWYRKAAEQGHAQSQFNLGLAYSSGRGVRRNDKLAVRWYRKAAEQGDAMGQFNLGVRYHNGKGVRQDYVLAHKWLNLASAQNAKFRKGLKVATRPMTRAQIAQAQRLAREWQPQPVDRGKSDSKKRRGSKKARRNSSGSGFFVSESGLILTNHHVVWGCARIISEKYGTLTVVQTNQEIDLALLRTEVSRTPSAPSFRSGPLELGEKILAFGYPLSGILATEMNVTSGVVSSRAGLRGDARYVQISAAVQPGNSGGPLIDSSGRVVGIVTSTLDKLEAAVKGGFIPENVAFALNAKMIKAFLQLENVKINISDAAPEMNQRGIARSALKYAVHVKCVAGRNEASIDKIKSRARTVTATPRTQSVKTRRKQPKVVRRKRVRPPAANWADQLFQK